MLDSKVRKRVLPEGWYPSSSREIEELIREWEESPQDEAEIRGIGAIVPHAGWYFSGKLAYNTLRRLEQGSETVLIIGGHMPPGSGIVAARESLVESPYGEIPLDTYFLTRMEKQVEIGADTLPDNTVEVQIPLIRHLFPEAELVWLRVGSGDEAIELGRIISGIAKDLDKKISVVGSTDLTHYGPNYGFTSHGMGKEALEWAIKENDAGIIREMLEMNSEEILEWGNKYMAACSSGAAAAVVEYASEMGCRDGVLVGYGNSSKRNPGSSFVGYAGVIYSSAAS